MNKIYAETSAQEEPLYNIGVVARMTGIPVATLRVWERRYAFPSSARTGGGHRLYSEKEVARLRWVKARIDEGMQTGRAIRALYHLEKEKRFPEPPAAAPASRLDDASLATFHDRLRESLLLHDTEAANRILGEALALYPLEDLVLYMVSPALTDIGDAWMSGRINAATEHLATNYLRHRLLMWMVTGPPPHPIQPVVLACAPEEWHEGSLLMLGVLLRRRGWPVAYLGQAVPLPDLADFVRQSTPPAVVLVAMTEEPARALEEWPRWLPEAAQTGHPLICYGGHIFTQQPEWRSRMPGVFLGETLQEGAAALDRLLRAAANLP